LPPVFSSLCKLKPIPVLLLVFTIAASLPAQQNTVPPKFALVIGNGAYTNLGSLANPANDANDISAVLQGLGFTVDKIVNGDLDQMENAVIRLKNRLSTSEDSYGFFFYAGHGVQSGGENYLIPVDANIPDENFLRNRAVSVQAVLDELNDARNNLNVVVLDACRDNPFGWARSTSRGLAIITRQPADSIIVYSTSAGQTASDGTGRNGLFTSQLLNNLRDPSLEVAEVFRRTGADVSSVSNRRQVPAVYNQFFGTAYLGTVSIQGTVGQATGILQISTITAGTVEINGMAVNQTVELPAWGNWTSDKEINAGTYHVTIRYEDGKTEEKTVELGRSETQKVEFDYRPVPLPLQPVVVAPVARAAPQPASTRLWTIGAAVGTAFSSPWLIGTMHGTIAPFNYSFLELGVDAGILEGSDAAYAKYGYVSLYPFAYYCFFLPLDNFGLNKFGLYAGVGGGLIYVSYDFQGDGGKYSENIPVAAASAGVIIFDMFNVSYTLRTNFSGLNSKLSAGYSYRFR